MELLEAHTRSLVPLFIEARRREWEASVRGTPEASRAAALAEGDVRKLHSDPALRTAVTRALERLTEPGLPADRDPLVRRQLELLQRSCIRNALPGPVIDELVTLGRSLETSFGTFRGTVRGERVSNNRILEILGISTDEALRREAWEASKAIGPEVADRLRDLARLRNEAARGLGYPDFYHMELALQEIDVGGLLSIFRELEELTEAPFAAEKARVDGELAARLGVTPDTLLPHHYEDPFFQEPPRSSGPAASLDALFADRDVVALAAGYFSGISLPVGEILERSDLYEREGKDQHAFCMDIDRRGDVRILCNVRPDERWAQTLLHELGHAVYDRGIPPGLPFLLRQPAHVMTTEAVALLFGRLTRHGGWLAECVGLRADDGAGLKAALAAEQQRAMLIFVRWVLVMTQFEREFYADPERGDLNELWWDLVAGLQRIRPPPGHRERCDWATKVHLAAAPVYYHNYLLGELMASQLEAFIHREVATRERGWCGRSEVGGYLRERVFAPGATLDWNALARHATGRPLEPEEFVRQFVDPR